MADFAIEHKKIAKNTLYLYSRMFIVMIVNFYAVRVLLQVLGVEDYGIFSIAMGVIALFSMLANAMSRATQRFLSIAIVKDERNDGQHVFTICFYFFLGASFILMILTESIGLYFFKHKIQIPDTRYSIALFVYQMSVLCVIINTLNIPFMASVVAKEEMSFLAKIGFLEAALKMIIVLLLRFCHFNNALIAYSILTVISSFIVFFTYSVFCFRNFVFCRFTKRIEYFVIREILQFSGWSLLGASANLAKTQGINILLNMFYGLRFNTTWGITSQVASGVNGFISNFQQAFNPEILKSQANEEKQSFWKLLFSSAKISYMLFLFICSPLLMHLTYVLHLWLGKENCPPQIELFIVFALIYFMIDCFSGPFWTAVDAIGHIMVYQIIISTLIIGGVLVTYLLFSFQGVPAYTAMGVNVFFNILCLVFRLIYLKVKINLPILSFFQETLLPSFEVTLLSFAVIWGTKLIVVNTTFPSFILTSGILSCCNIVFFLLFGFTKEEKKKALDIIRNRMKG